MPEALFVECAAALAVVTLNRPDRLNAINDRMIDDLTASLGELSRDPELRAVIITGSGDKAFCAGIDLKDRMGLAEAALLEQRRRMVEMFAAIRQFPLPIIAAVNGVALGGGLEIALNCDFIIASDHATFGMPEVKRGIMPGGGGTTLLPQRIGIGRAREMIYTGASIDAAEAATVGLVNEVVPAARLMEAVRQIAQTIAANSPIGIRQSKRAINANLAVEEAIRFEAEAYHVVLYSEDRREGLRAFEEKRTPVYKGK